MNKLYIITAAAFITIMSSMGAYAACNFAQNAINLTTNGIGGLEEAAGCEGTGCSISPFIFGVIQDRHVNSGRETGRTTFTSEGTTGRTCTDQQLGEQNDDDPISPVQ